MLEKAPIWNCYPLIFVGLWESAVNEREFSMYIPTQKMFKIL